MRTRFTTCALALTLGLALGASPALALTRHDAVWSAAGSTCVALGVPRAETMYYTQLRLRGHHASFWATCQDGVLIAEAQVSVVELPSGALHLHLTHAHRWLMPQPDPAPEQR